MTRVCLVKHLLSASADPCYLGYLDQIQGLNKQTTATNNKTHRTYNSATILKSRAASKSHTGRHRRDIRHDTTVPHTRQPLQSCELTRCMNTPDGFRDQAEGITTLKEHGACARDHPPNLISAECDDWVGLFLVMTMMQTNERRLRTNNID